MEFKELINKEGLSEEDAKRMDAFADSIDKAIDAKLEDAKKGMSTDEAVDAKIAEAVKKIEMPVAGVSKEDFEAYQKSTDEELLKLKKNKEGKEMKKESFDFRGALKGYLNEKTDELDVKALASKKVAMEVKAAATISTSSITDLGITTDMAFDIPRWWSPLRDVASVTPINGRSVVIAEYAYKEGDAAVTAEGAAKPMMDATLTERTITAQKVALYSKFTEETVYDYSSFVAEVTNEIVNRIENKETEVILTAVNSQLPAYTLSTLEVANPNYLDALKAAYTQVIAAGYTPSAVLLNPVDVAAIDLIKDSTGSPIRNLYDNLTLFGTMRIIPTTTVAVGNFILGDFRYLNIRPYMDLRLEWGWENDDFTKNIVTLVGEERVLAYIKAHNSGAFCKSTFATVITAITPA